MTFLTPRVCLSSASIRSRLLPGLRLSLTIELSVMRRVSSPSVSKEPPSAISGALLRGMSYAVRRVRPTRASLVCCCLLPQPLKLKSMPVTLPSSSTNTGTVSRAHRSSTASGTTSTSRPHAFWAAFCWSGLASITTYSYSATAWAMRAMSSRT